jgi:hypothetical protein
VGGGGGVVGGGWLLVVGVETYLSVPLRSS